MTIGSLLAELEPTNAGVMHWCTCKREKYAMGWIILDVTGWPNWHCGIYMHQSSPIEYPKKACQKYMFKF